MSVLNLYPHRLFYKRQENSYVDEHGDWHQGKEVTQFICCCDLVPAGSANVVEIGDGEKISYSYTVYLPATCRGFNHGDKVVICHFGKQEEFKVKGFQRFQLQCKMWV